MISSPFRRPAQDWPVLGLPQCSDEMAKNAGVRDIKRGLVTSALSLSFAALLLVNIARADNTITIPDVDLGTNPVFDLANTPLAITILQFASIKFRDDALQTRLSTDINALSPKISDAIQGKQLGYLIEVNIFSGEGDTLHVPGGQLVSLVGPGREPVDSLAEMMRTPRIANPVPAAMKNRSFYVWIRPDGTAMKATVMTPEFSRVIAKNAQEEAIRRQRLAVFERADPSSLEASVQRAEYWHDLYQRRQVEVADQDTRLKIEQLNREMKLQQGKVNELYMEYQRALTAAERANRFADSMRIVNSLTSFMNVAIQAGNVVSNQGPVGTAGKPQISGGALMDHTSTEITRNGEILTSRASQIRVLLGPLEQTEIRLRQAWESQGVRIPQQDRPPINLELR